MNETLALLHTKLSSHCFVSAIAASTRSNGSTNLCPVLFLGSVMKRFPMNYLIIKTFNLICYFGGDFCRELSTDSSSFSSSVRGCLWCVAAYTGEIFGPVCRTRDFVCTWRHTAHHTPRLCKWVWHVSIQNLRENSF